VLFRRDLRGFELDHGVNVLDSGVVGPRIVVFAVCTVLVEQFSSEVCTFVVGLGCIAEFFISVVLAVEFPRLFF
jgi:hypothetical protein